MSSMTSPQGVKNSRSLKEHLFSNARSHQMVDLKDPVPRRQSEKQPDASTAVKIHFMGKLLLFLLGTTLLALSLSGAGGMAGMPSIRTHRRLLAHSISDEKESETATCNVLVLDAKSDSDLLQTTWAGKERLQDLRKQGLIDADYSTPEIVLTISYDDGTEVYTGPLLHGYRHGVGTIVYRDGRSYEGNFTNDEREGRGKRFRSDGTLYYRGQWKNDTMTGHGKYMYPCTADSEWGYYEGDFRNSKYDGSGKLFDKAGVLRYDGMWKVDKHGHGTFIFTNALGEETHQYTGEFCEGHILKDDGTKGTYRYPHGDTRWKQGVWRDGVFHKEWGEKVYPDGSVRMGRWDENGHFILYPRAPAAAGAGALPNAIRRLAETPSLTSTDVHLPPFLSKVAQALIACALFLALLCCYLFVKRQKPQTEPSPEDLC